MRLLRVLSTARSPMGVGALAEAARLERTSTRRALGMLLDAGIVAVQGQARASRYALRRAHPLASAITALFQAERRRAQAVMDGIRSAVGQLSPQPIAVWLEGAVATETDEPGEPLLIRVVSSSGNLRETIDHLRERLAGLEQELDVTIDVVGTTPADLASRLPEDPVWDARLRSARSIAGLPPAAFLAKDKEKPTHRVRTHAELDERALATAAAIAERLERDPSLVARALDFVERRLADASPRERHELEEWRRLLRTASPMRLRRFLVDRGERATRLRQTLPFLGVLTDEERAALLGATANQRRRRGRDT
ncbi:MAG: helix-turn-helix domain-containing protein [Gemmatimonadaceae bacterium]|nr:helix-turn-helix domain-containing protein [Gemmatimonadaceae bacterium]